MHHEVSHDASAVCRDLVGRARELQPLLRANSAQIEKERRLTPEVESALRSAGLFRLTTPRRFGGHQVNIRTYLTVTSEIARGDSSAGWVSMILGGGNFATALFSLQAQEDVWGNDPDAAVSGVLSPSATSEKIDGGYRISGRWAFNSGCYQAQWAALAFPITNEKGDVADLGLALVPYSDLTIEDTWHVAGMSGTGSNTSVGDSIFVPEHRVASLGSIGQGANATQHPDEVEYQTAVVSALTLAVIGPQLGMAQAALDFARQTLASGKPIAYSFYERSVDSPSYRLNFADAVSLVDTARLHAFRAADDLDQAAAAGVFPDDLARARIRMDMGVAAKSARKAVDLLLNVCGAGSFAQNNPLQRVWRDIEVGSRHGQLNPDIGRETYANALLGLAPISPY